MENKQIQTTRQLLPHTLELLPKVAVRGWETEHSNVMSGSVLSMLTLLCVVFSTPLQPFSTQRQNDWIAKYLASITGFVILVQHMAKAFSLQVVQDLL